MAFVRDAVSCSPTPKYLPTIPIETQNDKLVDRIWKLDPEHALRLIFRFRERGIDLAGVDRGQQKDLVVPDDRGRASISVDSDFPSDVLPFAPFGWRRRGFRNTIRFWTSPLVPVLQLDFIEWLSLKLTRQTQKTAKFKKDTEQLAAHGLTTDSE